MNFSLYKQLSEDLLKILKALQITSDGKNPLNKDDFFCLLVDYNSSDEIQERIDNIDEKDNEFTDFIELLSREKISLRQLLGNKLYEGLKDKKSRDLQYYYFGKKTSPSPEECNHIFQTQKPAFDHLCKKYFISPSPEAYDMFISLLSLCIYFLSGLSFTKAKPISSRTHLHDSNSVQQFSSYLKKYKKVIVSGLHGTGKTTLLSLFLGEHKLDYIYLNYTDSLMQTFNQEIFSKVTDFENNLPFLKKKCSHSLLIIDGMNPKKSVFMEEVEKLASLKMRVILITTHAICPSGFHRYSAPLFNNEELCSIIPHNFPVEIASENLLEFTGKNPYLLSLAASTGVKNPDALNILLKDSAVLPTKTLLPRFKHPYHPTNTDFWGHANKVYDLYHNKEDYQLHRNHLKVLSCFFDYSVSIDFFKYIFSEYNKNVLQELADMGYLQFVDGDNKVRLSPAMANIIFIHEKPSYSDTILNQIINNIKNYLESYDVSLDLALLENILYPFTMRLGPTILQKNNPNQKTISQNQENWWSFLYLTIEYYQMLNKPDTVSSLIKLLIYPEGIQYKKSPYEASILKIFTSWIKGEPAFRDSIDSLRTIISDPAKFSPYEVLKSRDMLQYLACNGLDFLIYQELQNPFTPVKIIPNKNAVLFISILKSIYESMDDATYHYYSQLFLLVFTNSYLESWEFWAENLKIACARQKKTRRLYYICAFIYVCIKKILNELPEHHFEILTTALSKLKVEIDSVCMLPGLLGQICLVTCTNCHMLMRKGCYPAISLTNEILTSIEGKYSTISSEEWDHWHKTLNDL